MDGKVSTNDCTVVSSLYTHNGLSERDIAILHAGSYNAAYYLQISADAIPENAIVDVLGYPGELKSEWMRTQVVNDVDESLNAAAKLLPKRTLTVSRGTVQSIGSTVSYNLSTCPGMSGSCVLHRGKVIGIDLIKR